MLKNLIILPDGTELTSGTGQTNNIRTITLTECVNSSEELTLGSVCAAMVEVTVQTPRGTLSLTAGEEVTLCKVDNAGTRHKVGPFTLEKPTRASANILKLTGYDRVARLDKDLTAWLNSLTGWPYTLWAFAGMVCNACGLKLATTSIPNGDFLVQKITKEATGRQVMQWIGEVCCRFCRANADGEIELAWYTPAGISITPSGEHYFFQRGLTFEDYEVAPIDAVQLKLTDSENGALWPEASEGANSYIITGNPILMASITDDTLAAIQNIRNELSGAAYTPCEVAIPATLDIHAGNTVQITDANGVTITAYVMTKTQKGNKDTLECTGSPRRDSATAQNNKSGREKSAAVAAYADSAAKQAVNGQTQEDIFNKLTDNGAIQGIYQKDGKWYINAELAQILNLITEHLKTVGESAVFEAVANVLSMTQGGNTLLWMSTEYDGYPVIYLTQYQGAAMTARMEAGPAGVQLLDLTGDVPTPLVGMAIEGGKGILSTDSLLPSGSGNCKWEYVASIGKTVLVQV